MKKEFVVIGLGRFGSSICRELSEQGMEVMAIDRDEDRVNEFASKRKSLINKISDGINKSRPRINAITSANAIASFVTFSWTVIYGYKMYGK